MKPAIENQIRKKNISAAAAKTQSRDSFENSWTPDQSGFISCIGRQGATNIFFMMLILCFIQKCSFIYISGGKSSLWTSDGHID